MKNIYIVRTKEKDNYIFVKNIVNNNDYIIYNQKSNSINNFNNIINIEIYYKNFLNIKFNEMINPKINIYLTDVDSFEFTNKDELFLFVNNFIKFNNNNNIFCYSNFYIFDIIKRIFVYKKENYTKIISNLTENVSFYDFFNFILENNNELKNTNINIFNFIFYIFYLTFLKKDKKIITIDKKI